MATPALKQSDACETRVCSGSTILAVSGGARHFSRFSPSAVIIAREIGGAHSSRKCNTLWSRTHVGQATTGAETLETDRERAERHERERKEANERHERERKAARERAAKKRKEEHRRHDQERRGG